MSDYPQEWHDALRAEGGTVEGATQARVDVDFECAYHLRPLEPSEPPVERLNTELPGDVVRFLGCPQPDCPTKILMRVRPVSA